MIILGRYKKTNERYLAIVNILDLREIGKTKKEMFEKLANNIKNSLEEISEEKTDFFINDLGNSKFELVVNDLKIFNSFLFKSLRKRAKESQEKTASNSKMIRGSYKLYEEGKREPSLSKFNELINALGYDWELTLKRKVKK